MTDLKEPAWPLNDLLTLIQGSVHGARGRQIQPGDTFFDVLGASSLELMHLDAAIEERFGIASVVEQWALSDAAALANFSVASLAESLQRRLATAAKSKG
jgi:acyl carrier protein